MSRLPAVTEADLDDEQRVLWDAVTSTRGGAAFDVVGPDGGLAGPFNAMIAVPQIGRRLLSLGGHLRFETSIERRLTEVAICTVGAHWRSEFEFWAHAPMAIEHGVPDAVVEALAAGEVPEFVRDDERVVHRIASQLLTDRRVDDVTYAAAREVLGDVGLVELVALIGYYCSISLMLNLFEVGLQKGEQLRWPS